MDLPRLAPNPQQGCRLVNSKFPPIHLFDDVATAGEFEMLYELQAMTNPRLRTEVGDIGLIPVADIPFGIPGCSYATAPFTHVNPAGSRFSRGHFGVLYVADTMDTALAEVAHHQEAYWRNLPDLSYERFVFRGLDCRFDEDAMADGLALAQDHAVYDASDYSEARALGDTLKHAGIPGLRYHSVRQPGAICWALMTPRPVTSVVQTAHYEMIWNGTISSISRLSLQ